MAYFPKSQVDLDEDERPSNIELNAFTRSAELACQVHRIYFLCSLLNDRCRPADIRSSLNHLAQLSKNELEGTKKPAKKRMRFDDQRAKATQKRREDVSSAETFHFIGYVPAHGKVWELDGLKAGPLEVGELPVPGSTEGWEEIVRPALRMKMAKYGGMDAYDANIRFNLLALVDDPFETKSDELRLLVKEKNALEDRLTEVYGECWKEV